VLTAIRTGDAEEARRAMNSHMDQTPNELTTFVL
jgi:DNA-binding GntR family transcriptional regulator